MLAREIMTRDLTAIGPDAMVAEAADKMRRLDVGVLPVVDDNHLVGIVTDRDLTIRSTAAEGDPTVDKIREVMTPTPIYCWDDAELSEVSRLMEHHQIRRIPVLDHDDHLVGMISLGDIAVVLGDKRLSGSVLEQVSSPSEPRRS
jgi:CBS domain-containing protein